MTEQQPTIQTPAQDQPPKQESKRKKGNKVQPVSNMPPTTQNVDAHEVKAYKKETIPKAIREQTWIKYIGNKFKSKCTIKWCKNTINVFDFHVGHNIPEAKGGSLDISNLRPICARCNLSMSSKYSITEWQKIGSPTTTGWRKYFCLF
jgi:hypothetical protein